MVGVDRNDVTRPEVAVLAAPEGVLLLEIRGQITFARATELLSLAERALASHPGRHAIVVDLLKLDAFEPGVPARVIHWMAARTPQLAGALIATTNPVLIATARAAAVMIPSLECRAVPSRVEAVREAASLVKPSNRQQTGVHRKAPPAQRSAGERKAAG